VTTSFLSHFLEHSLTFISDAPTPITDSQHVLQKLLTQKSWASFNSNLFSHHWFLCSIVLSNRHWSKPLPSPKLSSNISTSVSSPSSSSSSSSSAPPLAHFASNAWSSSGAVLISSIKTSVLKVSNPNDPEIISLYSRSSPANKKLASPPFCLIDITAGSSAFN